MEDAQSLLVAFGLNYGPKEALRTAESTDFYFFPVFQCCSVIQWLISPTQENAFHATVL
jgi:hypothetical protein